MKISIIAACDKNRLIGVDGKMPWQLSEDLKRFKKITMGHAVVMGTGTKTSLGGMFPLPDRHNFVITSKAKFKRTVSASRDWKHQESINIENVINYCTTFDGTYKEVFIIGGQKIFEEGLQYADTIYLTELDGEYDGVDQASKRYFPVLNDKEWYLDRAERVRGVPCSFMVYRKKNDRTNTLSK